MKGAILLVTCFASISLSIAADALCEGIPSGEIVHFACADDCTKYYECTEGVKIERQCIEGLWFNNASRSCELDDFGCAELSSAYCSSTTMDVFPYPSDCTRYLECNWGILTVGTCPGGLWFNAAIRTCVNPINSGCVPHISTIVPPFTAPDSVCWGVLPEETLLRPFPGDCNRYIECYGAQKTEMSCPAHLYFHFLKQMCDWPSESGCDPTTGIPDPATTVDPSPPTPPDGIDDPRCADGNTDYWPLPECSKFIECYKGLGYEMDCPSGLYFNPIDKLCESPSSSSCGVSPTESVPTSTRDDDWTPHPLCPWPSTERYLYPYPGDCTRFFECVGGDLVQFLCPSGLWFNSDLMVCDYPYNSGCIP